MAAGTSPMNATDVVLQISEDAGTSYPTTTLRVKPNQTPISEDSTRATDFIENQTAITELYQELSYDELKGVLESWLNPSATGETQSESKSVSQEAIAPKQSQPSVDLGGSVETPSAPAVSQTTSDVEAAFDDLFNS